MSTMTIRVGGVIGTRRGQEHFAQTNSGIIAHQRRGGKAGFEQHGHAEWTREIEGAWQGHLETLQQYVCELLHEGRPPDHQPSH